MASLLNAPRPSTPPGDWAAEAGCWVVVGGEGCDWLLRLPWRRGGAGRGGELVFDVALSELYLLMLMIAERSESEGGSSVGLMPADSASVLRAVRAAVRAASRRVTPEGPVRRSRRSRNKEWSWRT